MKKTTYDKKLIERITKLFNKKGYIQIEYLNMNCSEK